MRFNFLNYAKYYGSCPNPSAEAISSWHRYRVVRDGRFRKIVNEPLLSSLCLCFISEYEKVVFDILYRCNYDVGNP